MLRIAQHDKAFRADQRPVPTNAPPPILPLKEEELVVAWDLQSHAWLLSGFKIRKIITPGLQTPENKGI
ncbi:hypothetical protein D0T56_02340 [Dysgonomonas sp. 520]|nr:hypothetical protein [Dysgonomonas sp. 520]